MVHLHSIGTNVSELQQKTRLALHALKEQKSIALSTKKAFNPFCSEIRHFRTLFDISDSESMMDWGMWLLYRCEQTPQSCPNIDRLLGTLYGLMCHETGCFDPVNVIVEESFDDVFLTIRFEKAIHSHPMLNELVQWMSDDCIIDEMNLYLRLSLVNRKESTGNSATDGAVSDRKHTQLDDEAKELLRHSFVEKTSAHDYVADLGGDILDEILDLSSADGEWKNALRLLEEREDVEHLVAFADGVLGIYVKALNGLFEFTALGYALNTLSVFLKEHADEIVSIPQKREKLIMLLETLGDDLASWRQHVFVDQDTADIHYLDSSFFSSCMQIEEILGDQEISVDDNNDIEFF